LLKGSKTPDNRCKLAIVCIKMDKYTEAERALIIKSSIDIDNIQVAGGASGYYLLGRIYEKQGKTREAIKFYHKSLELNPTLWISFERLCKLDHQIKAESIFKDNNAVISTMSSIMSNSDYFNKTGESLDSHLQSYKSRIINPY